MSISQVDYSVNLEISTRLEKIRDQLNLEAGTCLSDNEFFQRLVDEFNISRLLEGEE